MSKTVKTLAVAGALCATIAYAAGPDLPGNAETRYLPNGALTYEIFEATVEHALERMLVE